jgi:DNA-binding SARP family transcriptional activator
MRHRPLDGLAAEDEGVPLELGTPKQPAVPANLVLERDQVVPAERIIDLPWGDATASRRKVR